MWRLVWYDCFFNLESQQWHRNNPRSATLQTSFKHQTPTAWRICFFFSVCSPATKNWTAWWTNHLWIDPQTLWTPRMQKETTNSKDITNTTNVQDTGLKPPAFPSVLSNVSSFNHVFPCELILSSTEMTPLIHQVSLHQPSEDGWDVHS